MPNNRRLMSETLRADLARELGVYELAERHGWGAVSARDCGRLVQRAVRRAEELLAARYGSGPGMTGGAPAGMAAGGTGWNAVPVVPGRDGAVAAYRGHARRELLPSAGPGGGLRY